MKDFRKTNNNFGVLATNNLLRAIAQTIYKKMRRNEDMYRYSDNGKFYRIHTGGDEFAFIIEGNQAEALGFINRLAKNDFSKLSSLTEEILGKQIKLSFHCALVEMDTRDTFENILQRANQCYCQAKEGDQDFTICWHPNNVESQLDSDWEKKAYKDTRNFFQVLTMEDKEYI